MIGTILKYIPTMISIRARANRLKGSMSSETTKDQASAVAMSALAIAALQQSVNIDDNIASAAVTVLVWVIGSFVGPAVMRMWKYVEKRGTPVTHEATPATEDPIRDKVRADALRKAQEAIEANKKPMLEMVQFKGGAPVWLRDPLSWTDAINSGYDLGRDARGVMHELWKEREASKQENEG